MNEIFATPLDQRNPGYAYVDKSFVVLLPKLIVIFAALSLVAAGALPQLEMALTGGSFPFNPKPLSLLIIGLGAIVLLKGKLRASPLLPLTLVLSSYVIIEGLYLHFSKGLSSAAIRSCLDSFAFIVIAGAAHEVPLRLKTRDLLTFIFVLTFASLALSAAQFVTNSPIVPTESTEHNFHVQSYGFLNLTRCFSLFPNGLEAGVFYSFMAGVACTYCFGTKRRNFGPPLLLLCAFGCYATYTRLAMIGFVLTVIAAFVLSRAKLTKLSRLLPLFSLCCALLTVAQGLRTSGGAGRNDLANISSLDERIAAWGMYTGRFVAESPTDILLGTGAGPYEPYDTADRLENASPIPVDNTYLLVLLSTGVVGLVLISVTYWSFWTFLHNRTRLINDSFTGGTAAIFSTLPFFCSINDLPVQAILLFLLAASLDEGNATKPPNSGASSDDPYLSVA